MVLDPESGFRTRDEFRLRLRGNTGNQRATVTRDSHIPSRPELVRTHVSIKNPGRNIDALPLGRVGLTDRRLTSGHLVLKSKCILHVNAAYGFRWRVHVCQHIPTAYACTAEVPHPQHQVIDAAEQ